MNKYLKLILSILFCLFVGFAGSLATTPSIPTWYATLNKPFFSPPNWLFGPVWTLLYIFMGISLYLIWSKPKKLKIIFFTQLFLNFLWSLIFFGLHQPLLAFLEIIALWYFIFFYIRQALLVSRLAAYLFYPYLAWVSFASILNLAVALLN